MYDMKHMKRLARLGELAPDAFKAFQDFDRKALEEGAVPARTKAMIALAVALTTRCVYCIEVHKRRAGKQGISEQEMAEVALVATALNAGAALAHASHLLADAGDA
jgi:AhpD family alkylhydroperoxidase